MAGDSIERPSDILSQISRSIETNIKTLCSGQTRAIRCELLASERRSPESVYVCDQQLFQFGARLRGSNRYFSIDRDIGPLRPYIILPARDSSGASITRVSIE